MGWAIVEVMGHRRYAGEIEEVTVAGAPMLRVRCPGYTRERVEVEYRDADGHLCPAWRGGLEYERAVSELHAAFEVDLGGAAIFAITRCSEERARAARPMCHDGPEEPLVDRGEWRLRAARSLEGPVEEAEEVVRCEGCRAPATRRDSDDVPLCGPCFDALPVLGAGGEG